MSRPGVWVTIDVKVSPIEGAEPEPWVEPERWTRPPRDAVAALIRERVEGARDIHRGYEVVSVSAADPDSLTPMQRGALNR